MRAKLVVIVVAGLALMGCSGANQPGTVAAADGDPANGNLAPVAQGQGDQGETPANQQPVSGVQGSAPQYQSQAPQQNPAPQPPVYSSGTSNAGYDTSADYSGTEDQVVYADQAPPPLPEYSQPSCPGENYIWTPGVWDYGSGGYYWVPGAWVLAPYVGALWTPPYWESYEHRYRWHRGFWGEHIGFYGGIDYGFGYVGRGYYGGYWHGNDFAYNRSVTNVNENVIRNVNVYNYRVTNVTNTRVSYNGPGGVGLRPTAPEVAALHERWMAPVAAQVAQTRQAEGNRAQFAAVNRGKPAQVAVERPLRTDYKAPAAEPGEVAGHPKVFAGAAPARQPPDLRAQVRPEPQPVRPEPQARPITQQARPMPQQARPEPQARPIPQQARPEPQARPITQQARPEPQARPMPQQARPEPQARPAPARAEPRAAPPAPHPAPPKAEPARREEKKP